MNAIELAIRKKNTRRFIAAKPKTINLIPNGKTEVAGTVSFTEQPPRGDQIFRIIYTDIEGRTRDSDRTNYRNEFILVGESTRVVAIGDHWSEGDQSYVVEWVAPDNGYELKCGGTTHGPDES